MALAARFPRGFECLAELTRELVRGCTVRRYKQLETSPETIEQELRPAVCEHRQTDRLKENYSIDIQHTAVYVTTASQLTMRTTLT